MHEPRNFVTITVGKRWFERRIKRALGRAAIRTMRAIDKIERANPQAGAKAVGEAIRLLERDLYAIIDEIYDK